MALIMTKNETIKRVDEQLEMFKYDLKKARSPRKKKNIKSFINFFESINYHLKS